MRPGIPTWTQLCTLHSQQAEDFVGFRRGVRDRNRNSGNQHSLYYAAHVVVVAPVAVTVVVVIVVAAAVVHINKCHSNAAQSRRSAFLSARHSASQPHEPRCLCSVASFSLYVTVEVVRVSARLNTCSSLKVKTSATLLLPPLLTCRRRRSPH